MPTYSYYCNNCEKEYILYSIPIKKRKNQKCSKCGKKMTLLISKVNFTIKGFNAKNSYGVNETVGELMDKVDKRLGRKPGGEEINDLVTTRKARKKMPRLVEG